MTSRDHAMRMLGWRLKQAGLPTPELDARILVQAVTGATDIEMIREPAAPISAAEEEALAGFERRRLAREPVSRILGAREFWGLAFAVTSATLDPRPDSETLIEASLKCLAPLARPRLLDLGTGTGCLLLTLLHERPDASGIGVDISEEALQVARENSARLGLAARARFQPGNWMEGLGEKFDLVISNPPYIASGEIEVLEPEVRGHDPRLALDGGADGLDAYRAIAAALPDVLTQEGVAVVELGAGQADAVRGIFEAAGCAVLRVDPDLSGVPRALVAALPRA
ncbi:modification methylase, HemK family [Parvibaculum lavamentivorans DS-1]|uniref:Release factor glutamine methyltransferase n=1 Tax=Parvibaculum lavamentivorans (strain DS-1 / DSM 13023 / NCIMB 13966) TaxID=402881 RepID=A7HTY4_PARL1|nr:peptide chain release factor N(5)-glutamine methyltransferase [Parvibaculum lavamentivorans]ABS63367.1 modification methylase, HemK family [Parvibaculum lavamentivorans DS-1]